MSSARVGGDVGGVLEDEHAVVMHAFRRARPS